MSRKGKEKENQNPQDKTPYITVQRRLQRHIQSGRSWLAQEKQWLQPYDAQGVSVDKQLPIYQPSKKIAVITSKAFSYSLTCYLKEEKTQHSGQRRLLSIPIYTDDHWAVLTLYINEHDQLHSAAYIDSIQSNQQHPTPLPTQHLIVCAIKETYPNYQGTVLQHQYYHHSDKTLSASIMAENAEASIRRFYFGNRVPLRPRLWTNMPTAQKSGISAFETELPVEAQMYALSFLGPQSRAQFAQSSKNNAVLADEQHFWKQLYLAWSRYLIIPTPHKKPPEPKCYKTAFKRLYLSISPEERTLVQAAVVGNQKIPYKYRHDPQLYKKYRGRLLVIATCHGDIESLRSMSCLPREVLRFALISYSAHAKENRQAVLDYFWDNFQSHFKLSPTNIAYVHVAAGYNQPKALATALKTAIFKKNATLVHQPNEFGISPFMMAEYNGHKQCIKVFDEHAPRDTKEELNLKFKKIYLCCTEGLAETMAILLQYGANPNLMSKFGFTPLMRTVVGSNIDQAQLLLQCGAKPNLRSKMGYTALMSAAELGNLNMVRLLLQHGADPYLLDQSGKTVSSYTLKSMDIDTVWFLLQYKPDLYDNIVLAIDTPTDGFENKKICFLRDSTSLSSISNHKITCLVFVVKLLRNLEVNSTEDIHSIIKHHEPRYFIKLVKKILTDRNYWPWVTEKMRERLRKDPLVQELGIVEKPAELEPEIRGPRPR